MPANLVKRAIEQSRSREPLVRVMALLGGARVLATVDQEAAKQAFAEGVATAENLPLAARHLELVLDQAIQLGTMADPLAALSLFRRLPSGEHRLWPSPTGSMLVRSLLQSGDVETAIELLEDLNCETGEADVVVRVASDPALQRRAMLAARERWRALRKRPDFPWPALAQHEFYRLFSQHWRKLEPSEAETWLDEILLAIETDPDHPAGFRFGDGVELHSARDGHLFEILNVLRTLKPPDQVEAILRVHPDVDAARVYLLSLETSTAQQRPAPQSGRREGSIGGSSGFGDRRVAAMRAAQRGDPSAVQPLLAEARRLHLEDTDTNDPNLIPRIFWPSYHAYKVAMYWAGKHLGKDAEPLLAEIQDPDFALLASIDLAAGALGLPQHSGVQIEHYPKGTHRKCRK